MDVIPTVARETASRYHKRSGDRPMSSAMTADLTALLTRLWLLKQPDGLDSAGDVASSVATIEQQVEDMVDFLLHRCQAPTLATLSLQVRSDTVRRTHEEQARQAAVKKEAISVQLEDGVLGMESGLVTVEQVWAALAVILVHQYSSSSVGGALGSPSGTTTSAASAAAAAGAPMSDPAYSEAVAAVSAALPRPQVAGFLRQDRVERARQLRQVRRIAWGLRLYQRETGRSVGNGVASLTLAVDAPLTTLEGRCADALSALESRVRLTRALLTSPTCTLTARTLEALRTEYHHLLLMLHVLRSVQCGLQQLRNCVTGSVMTVYHTNIEALHALLSPARKAHQTPTSTNADANAAASTTSATGEAAPRRVVFPKFMELADAYELGMQCMEAYSQHAALLQIVAESAEGYESALPPSAAEDALAREDAACAGTSATPSPTSRHSSTSPAALEAEVTALLTSQATCQRLPPEVHVRYCAELPLHTVDPVVAQFYPESSCAMRGYCPVRYLDGRPTAGLLLPGHVTREAPTKVSFPLSAKNINGKLRLGCIEVSGGTGTAALYRPLRFLFSDAAAMRTFAADPWRYVAGCLRVFHTAEPTISLVMGLAEELPRELYLEGSRRVERLSSMVSNAQASTGRVDCGTQTGQIDARIDHHYFWNEWDLRRHALKLANIMQMRTHSSQTAASHFRREATTQVHPLKDSETQTLRDAATQPPRVVQYLKGLRGTEASAVVQVQSVVEY